MHQITRGVSLLPVLPRHAINAYLVGDVLVDAGIRWAWAWLMRQLPGRRLAAHALTHPHPDHQGCSHAICAALGLPLWCGERDAAAMERGEVAGLLPGRPLNRLLTSLAAGPPHPVARQLREGDAVADFVVLETPGHTPGHLSLWRESDRTLILGDVLANQHPITGRVGLIEPLRQFTPDPAENRRSARRIAALEPRLVCFGHGPPLRDPARLAAFVASLG